MNLHEVSVQELQAMKESGADIFILDVRDQWEFDKCNLGGHLIPIKELPERLNELDPNKHIIVHCQMGGRSSRAAMFLMERGFKNVSNLHGGIKAWATEIDPNMEQY
ncbi:MAG: rhodanese-like domain-containing protein [Gammaproteobacteria bacterium]|nr:rhodanese-like domain-containing protein [Gammaproteobacteria bacterium]